MYIIKEGVRLLFLFDYIRRLGKVRIQEIKLCGVIFIIVNSVL